MRIARRTLFGGLAIIAAVLLVFASPASASVVTRRTPLGAGYVASPAGGVTSASVSFFPPVGVTCVASSDLEAMVFGLIVEPNGGANLSDVGAFMLCSGGSTPSISYF